MSASPIIKWVGGKSKLLPALLARVPKKYKCYYEPFLGSGALFFALAPQEAVLGDMNEALISMYRTVRERPDAVISRLEKHRENNINGYYYEVRDWWNTHAHRTDDRVGAAAAFIFLNKTCFNGLWRVNKAGGFNVPKGDYENPSIFDADELRAAAVALGAASICHAPYADTLAQVREGDFVYLDPPYIPVSKTSNFTSYTKDAFGEAQQRDLALFARSLVENGAHVMLSNSDVPLVYELYRGFTIETIQRAGTVSSKASKRGKVNEVIITSYPRSAA